MADAISRELVAKTAHLGRLLLTEAEITGFAAQLGSIFAYIEKLGELDTTSTEPLAHVLPLSNVLRDDRVAPSIGTELALREAPASAGGFFKVPKVLGEGSGA
jgi:aspartyl-tRNA(Asn)/glutamyl-tRNA(Gln) amidotransferase subunit C